MRNKVELLAGHWTVAGDTYPNGPTEVSSLPFRDRVGGGGLGPAIPASALSIRIWSPIRDKIGFAGCDDFRRQRHRPLRGRVSCRLVRDAGKAGRADRVRNDLLEAAAELKARDIKIGGKFDAEQLRRFALCRGLRKPLRRCEEGRLDDRDRGASLHEHPRS